MTLPTQIMTFSGCGQDHNFYGQNQLVGKVTAGKVIGFKAGDLRFRLRFTFQVLRFCV